MDGLWLLGGGAWATRESVAAALLRVTGLLDGGARLASVAVLLRVTGLRTLLSAASVCVAAGSPTRRVWAVAATPAAAATAKRLLTSGP